MQVNYIRFFRRRVANEAVFTPNKPRVFVIHGRNEEMRRALFDFLSTIDLKPIEWSETVALTSKLTPFVGEILDTAMQHAQAIVVLFPVTTKPGYGWRLFLRVQHHSLPL